MRERLTKEARAGTTSDTESPPGNQPSCQKRALSPRPSTTFLVGCSSLLKNLSRSPCAAKRSNSCPFILTTSIYLDVVLFVWTYRYRMTDGRLWCITSISIGLGLVRIGIDLLTYTPSLLYYILASWALQYR